MYDRERPKDNPEFEKFYLKQNQEQCPDLSNIENKTVRLQIATLWDTNTNHAILKGLIYQLSKTEEV